jgi:hypothetical protein
MVLGWRGQVHYKLGQAPVHAMSDAWEKRMSEASNRVTIVVAVIGVIGTIGAAVIGNWDKIFPPTAPARKVEPVSLKTPPAQAIPNISGVWRDVEYPDNGSQLSQDGSRVRFTRWGVLPNGDRFESSGSGTVNGQGFISDYSARYRSGATSTGSCSGTVSTDGKHMKLTCNDSLLRTFSLSAIHQ